MKRVKPSNDARLTALMRKLKRHGAKIKAETTEAIATARECIPFLPLGQRASARAAIRTMEQNFKRHYGGK